MEPENSGAPEETAAPGPSRRPVNLALILVVALVVVAAAFFLHRRGGPGAAGPVAPASRGGPPPNAVTAVVAKLSPEAALVADRYNCLCGRCRDTLGKCTCAHDEVADDQSLLVETTAGQVLLLGCAHAGLINTLLHVRALTGRQRLAAVIGGTHLINASAARLARTLDELRQFEFDCLAPGHCTDPRSQMALAGQAGSRYAVHAVGRVYTW